MTKNYKICMYRGMFEKLLTKNSDPRNKSVAKL